MALKIVPISLRGANAYVRDHHRHHKPTVGHKFSIACADGQEIVGVAIVGRPVSRHLDDYWTLEVNRLCTDGTRNACSMLHALRCRMASCPGDGIQATDNVHSGERTGDKPESRWLEVHGEGRRPALDRRSLPGNGSLSGGNEIEMGSDD